MLEIRSRVARGKCVASVLGGGVIGPQWHKSVGGSRSPMAALRSRSGGVRSDVAVGEEMKRGESGMRGEHAEM